MLKLQEMLAEEQPHVRAVLDRHLEELPSLARPVAAYVLQAGGKRLRPALTLLTGRMLGCAHDDLYVLGCAVEMLHAATLMHDDILDNASTRRGKAAAHTVFGSTKVILAGDALLAKALLMVSQLHDARLTEAISAAVMHTANGELAEFSNTRNTTLTQAEYLDIITGKTAWMLRAACELGAIRAGADTGQVAALADFGRDLGIAFQIVDDALDFSPTEQTGKPQGGDLREGKVTPPLLLYIDQLPTDEAQRVRDGFAANTLTEDELAHIGAEIYSGGHARQTLAMAQTYIDQALTSLSRFPKNAERSILEEMAAYVCARTK